MEMKTFTAVIWKENKEYVSVCPELDVSSFGSTKKKALENLKEAIELYLETVKELKIKLPATTVIPLKV
ncbi:type II toxin-antitoxin system HicB family antitoxin [Candidatus Micrarchaeota archaeon]|nr:type II toxin-antitoxin system HicB family antitoxin [Candidatus Micrarchaeota archaeon]